jgi:uncharacterized membrane protein YidH (DUF202 family)
MLFTKKHDHDVDEDTPRHVDESARTTDEVTGRTTGREAAHEEFGGMNTGADFFGWLVAVAMAILLTGIIGAVAAVVAGVDETSDINQALDRPEGGTISVVSAVVLVLVVGVGYYAGGYVAGRMSRFDGARQGLGVWLIGLVVMIVAGVTGAVFGREYNVLDRVDLPQLPVSDSDASMGAVITGAALLLVSLVAALAGGKVGRNYHRKVDAAHVV